MSDKHTYECHIVVEVPGHTLDADMPTVVKALAETLARAVGANLAELAEALCAQRMIDTATLPMNGRPL